MMIDTLMLWAIKIQMKQLSILYVYTHSPVRVCVCPMLSDHTQCYENKMRQYLLLDFKAV